jgi:hypothetical protein
MKETNQKIETKIHYDVLSPDGFAIHRTKIYKSLDEAMEEAKEWVKGYQKQDYYSTPKFGRIPYDDILSYCHLVEVPEELVKVGKEDLLYHATIFLLMNEDKTTNTPQ